MGLTASLNYASWTPTLSNNSGSCVPTINAGGYTKCQYWLQGSLLSISGLVDMSWGATGTIGELLISYGGLVLPAQGTGGGGGYCSVYDFNSGNIQSTCIYIPSSRNFGILTGSLQGPGANGDRLLIQFGGLFPAV